MIQPCSPTNQRVHPAKETKPGAYSQPHAHTRPNPESPRFSPERAKKKSRNQKGKASFSLSSRSTTTTTRDELTAANRPARAAIPTAVNKPASAPTPPIQPDDRDELEKLLSAKHRPLSDIVGDFFAKFPRERRPSINHLLRVILNENRLNPEERLAAYAMLHQSIASVSENPDFSLLLDAASHESVDYSDRAFIQLLITASTKVLKQSPADYIDGNILSSMDLFPWEILEKRAMSKQQALVKLKDLCCILGISFKDKMLEFGVDEPDRERVVSSVEILQATAKINFNKLKIVATGLISEWKAANTPFKQMAWFNWVLEVHDTRSVDDVFGTNYLSTAAVIKAEKELSHLQTERLKKWRTKYLSQKKKLMKLLNDTHLKCGYVGFDPDEKVEAENCRREKKKLKDIIPGVKLLVKDRKELVLRVELLKRAVKSSNASLEAVEVMFTKAMEAAEKIGGGSASYDGEALEDVLRSLLKSPKQDAAERDEPVLQQPIEAITTKTRSGESFPILK